MDSPLEKMKNCRFSVINSEDRFLIFLSLLIAIAESMNEANIDHYRFSLMPVIYISRVFD